MRWKIHWHCTRFSGTVEVVHMWSGCFHTVKTCSDRLWLLKALKEELRLSFRFCFPYILMVTQELLVTLTVRWFGMKGNRSVYLFPCIWLVNFFLWPCLRHLFIYYVFPLFLACNSINHAGWPGQSCWTAWP